MVGGGGGVAGWWWWRVQGLHPYVDLKIRIFLRFAPPVQNTYNSHHLFQKSAYGPVIDSSLYFYLFTIIFLNIWTPKNFVVITLKFELCGSTIE